jgi:multiple sugar transport system ATP-binding protein
MNILESRIVRQGNGLGAIHAPTGVRIDLSQYAFAEPAEEGQEVLVGLRPEHFSIGPVNGRAPAARFDLPIRYSEKTGNEGTAFLAAGDELIAVRVDHDNFGLLEPGRTVGAHIPGHRLSVFDPGDGRRL